MVWYYFWFYRYCSSYCMILVKLFQFMVNCINSCFTWCNNSNYLAKKFTSKITLSVNNFYQAISAAFFLIIISYFFKTPFINFDNKFILSMGWQIIMVSFGAYAILMYLIKTGTASKTSNFFLIP